MNSEGLGLRVRGPRLSAHTLFTLSTIAHTCEMESDASESPKLVSKPSKLLPQQPTHYRASWSILGPPGPIETGGIIRLVDKRAEIDLGAPLGVLDALWTQAVAAELAAWHRRFSESGRRAPVDIELPPSLDATWTESLAAGLALHSLKFQRAGLKLPVDLTV